jgi:Spy/CpxP family protein refolding chaperone
MKTRIIFIVLFCAISSVARAQSTVEQFMHDQSLQDSIIAAIVPNHTLMSKLIDKIAENPQLHEMVIQHLTRLLNEKSGGTGEHDHASHETMSHYAGDEKREIKALSETEVKSFLNGEGMGFAMSAELNHYPGPRHVLDLEDQLHLTQVQKKSIKESFDQMHSQAVQLGEQLVEKERALDSAFVSRTVNLKSLEQMTKGIETLRGRLRYVHLAAHIKVRKMLTQEQIESYDQLRGYTGTK